MKWLKSLKIGNVELKNNLFLAPLAGYSDFAMREICQSFGAGLCYTEMVSAKGLYYDNENTENLLYTTDKEKIKAVQIFGNDPEIMKIAVESERLSKFDIIDINMGCPVPKVYNNGEGSALLKDLNLASKIIEECAKTGKVITVKTRIGITHGQNLAKEFAKMAESSGAKAVTIHGRVREDYYAGEVNFKAISEAKNAVKIPIIANGGVFSREDAEKLFEETGADGIMLARGAIYKPWLFREILENKFDTDERKTIIKHIDLLKTRYDDYQVATNIRKQLAGYLKGTKNGKQAKAKIFSATTTSEIKNILQTVLF